MTAETAWTGDRRTSGGQRVGNYELLGRLALGGMAELHLARRGGLRGFEKYVALKRILPHLAENVDFVDMFLHEAKLAATLEHPNIVDVYDVGRDESDTDYFFTMAYLHGKDLAKLLRHVGKRELMIPLPHVLTIAVGMCAGLHYAHERIGPDHTPLGIVHRDVSPANIIVTYDGGVKIVDFGIAKAGMRTAITRAGVRKGKAAYMSPEQCRGEPLDRRSDIWAIGVVLYELTTLTRLFRADHDLVAMSRVMNVDEPIVPPSRLVAQYPHELEAILMRCLQRDPKQRYQTALELQRALEAFMLRNKIWLSNSDLADYLHELFGSEPYPWALLGPDVSAPGGTVVVEGPPTNSSARGGDSTGDGWTPSRATNSFSPSMVAGRARSVTPWLALLTGVCLSVVVLVLVVRSRAAPAPEQPPRQVAAAPVEPEAAEDLAPEPSTAQLLRLLNEPDPAIALDFDRRHALMKRLHRDAPEAIDRHVQIGLDLVQAGAASDPCGVFDTALASVERSPGSHWDRWLRVAEIPDPKDPKCGELTRRFERAKRR